MSVGVVLNVLAERFRLDAVRFRELGQDSPAALLERVALEIEDHHSAYANERLTIAMAAEESGFSTSHLYTLVQNGRISNAGLKHSPRIRRGDLPLKGTRLRIDSEGSSESDLVDEILSSRRAL